MNRQHRQGWIAGIFVLASCSSPSSSAPDPGPADPGPGDLAPEPGPPPATWYHLEAVFEDGKVKAETFAKAQQYLKPDVIFASNTSTLPIT